MRNIFNRQKAGNFVLWLKHFKCDIEKRILVIVITRENFVIFITFM